MSQKEIEETIIEMAMEINREFLGKQPVFVCVLNGAFMFSSDLLKHITIDCSIEFVRLASYENMQTSGKVQELIGFNNSLEGAEVVILEDIIDTGITLNYIVEQLKLQSPSSIYIASLLLKPDAYHHQIPINCVGKEIPNDFVVGYGMDYNDLGRNLREIYSLVSN